MDKFPHAKNAFQVWETANALLKNSAVTYKSKLNHRPLYDFLDSQQIVCTVFFDEKLGFGWEIYEKKHMGKYIFEKYSLTREEAEKQCFAEALAILEDMLTPKI